MKFEDNGPKEQSGITILISDKIDFKLKLIRDKKGRYIDITIVNIYAPNSRAIKFRKERLSQHKSHIDPHPMIVGDQYHAFMNRLVFQIKHKYRNTRDSWCYYPNGHERYLLNISLKHTLINTNMQKHTFFAVPHGTISKIDYILRNKASLSRYKKIEIPPGILSNYHGLTLDINKRNNKKLSNSCVLNNSLLNKN